MMPKLLPATSTEKQKSVKCACSQVSDNIWVTWKEGAKCPQLADCYSDRSTTGSSKSVLLVDPRAVKGHLWHRNVPQTPSEWRETAAELKLRAPQPPNPKKTHSEQRDLWPPSYIAYSFTEICTEVKSQAEGENQTNKQKKINSRDGLKELQCRLLCVNHGGAEQEFLLLLFLLSSFLVWKRKCQRWANEWTNKDQTSDFICYG